MMYECRQVRRIVLLTSAFLACLVNPRGEASEAKTMSWPDAVEAVKADASCEPVVRALIESARKAAAMGLVRRVSRLEDVGKHRTWLDGRSKALEDEIRETFALAMSDFAACNTLAGELPMIAAGARFSGDAALRNHVIDQLREASTWSPLQRPGWTLYAPGHRLPKDGKDGNWLATGCGVRAIVTTLDIMGHEVPKDVRDALDGLLAKEIAGVVDDWKTKRPWFVRGNNAITNQWVLPTEGLVTACVHLGPDKHRQAYELGVKNLLQALSSHGKDGEFEEGIGYANFTVTSLVHAARAMAAVGDRRAIDHPFLANFPTWAVMHIQPGRMTVNCFDAGGAAIPRDHGGWRSMLSLLVFTLGSETANWALHEQFNGPSDDLIGLMARATGKQVGRKAPDLFAAYERATMVVWRDGWGDDASGVWVRGGHKLDQHDHEDRGHVNYIHRGRAILIEAGTPSYHNPRMGVEYASGAGHNVLQLGTFFPPEPYPVQKAALYDGWQQRHGLAPITVERLDGNGGVVRMEVQKCYPDLSHWDRAVEWSSGTVTVRDDVALKPGKASVILFRWHLGTDNEVALSRVDASTMTAKWDDVEIRFEGGGPIEAAQRKMPDATLAGKEDHMHACLEVRSAQPVSHLMLTTRVHVGQGS
ncbi:MAG: heparinase II/III family protein [Phycisphaerae bacterium]|nr:heparinase II/III family protein [Phycisphaerae bacterium]